MAEINPPVFLQGGSHGAAGIRRLFQALYVEGATGVFESGALAVSESLTPAMSVRVATGRALIAGSESTSSQGAYFVDNQGSTTLTLAPSSGVNPRHDLIIARVRDAQYSGTDNLWELAVVTGTPAGSPVDPSLAGIPNVLVLARVQVGTSVTTITNANITDLRFSTTGQTLLQPAGSTLSGLAANKPASPRVGTLYYETDAARLRVWTGSVWRPVGPVNGTVSGTGGASGYFTHTHGLGFTPSNVLVTGFTPSGGTTRLPSNCIVDTLTSTTFRIRMWGPTGDEVNTGAFTLHFAAFP